MNDKRKATIRKGLAGGSVFPVILKQKDLATIASRQIEQFEHQTTDHERREIQVDEETMRTGTGMGKPYSPFKLTKKKKRKNKFIIRIPYIFKYYCMWNINMYYVLMISINNKHYCN